MLFRKTRDHGLRRVGKRSLGTGLKSATAVCAMAAAMLVPAAQPAAAVTPGDVKDALTTAYDVYNKFFGHQLTLEQATAQIINAVNAAKAEILAHIDALAAGQVHGCARAAVIDLLDIGRLTPGEAQNFARDATACVTLAQADINVLTGSALDQVGFALNTVGPIALFARTYSGLTTPELTSTLVSANTNLVARLKPSCIAQWHWADATPQVVEVELFCDAYNGRQGIDFVLWHRKRPNPPIDYTGAIHDAMVGTSYPVGVGALSQLH
jgi:hypothetical protein